MRRSFFPPSCNRFVAITLAISGCLAPLPACFAAEVLVVTDGDHPVASDGNARIVRLDAPLAIEAELAANLPADPNLATRIVQQRLRGGTDELQRRLREAYQGVTEAWTLGITKIPAVVVDHRYVVYGESDVARAVARIAAYRSTHP
ncbi:TIGR03757 family integrating conjugative element protein [Ralstonia pseudosolanacearum]|uniref:TIGR03757 family integrating conjugative element protein n=1 Tax=Ralstonia pseudosolanacearum TaxID=1310165 RepID=UPI0040549082